jgi:hypothetical protein
MQFPRKPLYRRFAAFALSISLLLIPAAQSARAADHRDSPTADGAPEGDITDFFAFLDPNNANNLVLILDVNPFAVPAESSSYSFSNNYLYQFKVDTAGNGSENQVIQVVFASARTSECPSGQGVFVYGPAAPVMSGATNALVSEFPTVAACTGTTATQNGLTVFTGLRDDPFVFDFSQLARILNGSQDVFRNLPTTGLGPLRGRPVRTDGTSGVDSFGGFNVSSIAIEMPASFVQPQSNRINLWATVGAPATVSVAFGASPTWTQFQRMGQQAFKTVFVPAAQREAFNASIPANDTTNWSGLVPNALNSNDGNGNTPAARYNLLNGLGLFSPGVGAPALLGSNFPNTDLNLLREALLPDVIRLDLSLAPNNQAIGQFGLQNGRRPGDDAVDILLRIARQLADVDFAGSGRIGALQFNLGNLATADRRVFAVLQGTDFIRPDSTLGDLTVSGNDRPLLATFPFLASPSPLPGDNTTAPGTTGFPVQQLRQEAGE